MPGTGSTEKIKQAFLDLKRDSSFEQIMITDLCEKAGVSRTTFYRYYSRMEDVLDELIRDMLAQSEGFTDEQNAGVWGMKKRKKTPICDYLRSHPEYMPVFSDPTLTHVILRAIVQHQKDAFTAELMKTEALSRQEAEVLLYYHAAGCLAAISRSYGMSEKQWNTIRDRIDRSMSPIVRKAFDE